MTRLLAALMLLLAALPLPAAMLPAAADTTVYFVSVFPGRNVYELEGHSALAVVLPDGRSAAFNYGVFDFDSPNFLWRFVKGETDYMAAAMPLDFFLRSYEAEGRRVEALRLDMTAEQKRRLLLNLNHDVHPAYRTYRYNYVLDNCATRPLAAVERSLGDTIRLAPAPFESNSMPGITFRNIMRHYHSNYPWYQFGIDLALGSGIDRSISRRMCAFAPAELARMLPLATVAGRPLADSLIVVTPFAPDAAVEAPTPWYATPLAAAIALFALTVVITVRDIRRCRVSKLFDSSLFGIFGLAGLLLTFLIFVSVHEATSPNWLYAWLNPFCLVAAVLVWIKRAEKALVCYHFINFAVLIALAVAWPWLRQSANVAFIPLAAADLLRSGLYLYLYKRNCHPIK